MYLPILSSFFTSSFPFPLPRTPPRLRLPVMLMLHERKMRQETEKEGIYAQNASCLPLLLSHKSSVASRIFFLGSAAAFAQNFIMTGPLSPPTLPKRKHTIHHQPRPKVPFSRGHAPPPAAQSACKLGRRRARTGCRSRFFGRHVCSSLLSFPLLFCVFTVVNLRQVVSSVVWVSAPVVTCKVGSDEVRPKNVGILFCRYASKPPPPETVSFPPWEC